MRPSTTLRVSRRTRDGVRELAIADGATVDQEIRRLVRAERQRRIGSALAASDPDESEQGWVEISASSVSDHAVR